MLGTGMVTKFNSSKGSGRGKKRAGVTETEGVTRIGCSMSSRIKVTLPPSMPKLASLSPESVPPSICFSIRR